MMRAASDSDDCSITASSPSPLRFTNTPPIYYVESPSRDSHDGEKPSSRATPVYKSPLGSPSHLSQSRSSSASRVSGPFGLPPAVRQERRRRLMEKGWIDYTAIREAYNEAVEDDYLEKPSPVFKFCVVMAAFVLVSTVAGFILWRVSKQYVPVVALESLSLDYFHAGIGQDRTGVPTKMVGISCSVEFNVSNPAPYFGIHVTSTQATLFYSDIVVASSQLEEYYLSKKELQSKSIVLKGNQIPLYGAGVELDLSKTDISAPMLVIFDIKTQGNVVGFLVRRSYVAIFSRQGQQVRRVSSSVRCPSSAA
ncbi:hypothetical protein HPP92_000252 [Vanilla planifolia]|uniref:Late embryogenesis abundant protein LEA-2 subgroup domain-containing protein n=1 Tax=Vanilla planifolia TaxID=51239 RepID=A0A835RNT3_VANPL|nr:hypothetical protein HPP92_000252 [Vanilla planifolia]